MFTDSRDIPGGQEGLAVRRMYLLWDLPISSAEKLVMLALIDDPTGAGEGPDPVASLTRKCTLSERQVRMAIKRLVQGGHVYAIALPGGGVRYQTRPSVTLMTCHPEALP